MQKFVLSVLVEDHSGVLSRVSLLFSRRGYNIESLTVCRTNVAGRSRMTIVVTGDEHTLEQIIKQLSKLVEVISIKSCEKAKTIQRQMALIKVKAEPAMRAVITSTCQIYKAHVVDIGMNSLTIEITGGENKIESILKVLEPFEILEYVKTGITAMDRGDEVMN